MRTYYIYSDESVKGEIRDIFPNFNIGVNAGNRGSGNSFWEHPYRHWNFKPNE